MKKQRFPKGSVCKPCWELKYCPYGYLVEYFPLFHLNQQDPQFDTTQSFKEVLKEISQKQHFSQEEIHDYHRLLSILDPESNQYISQFAAEDVACRVFGHTCPVFFMQSGATETKDSRPEGRNIPREVMLKVVRRDNYICQECHKLVPDNEIEFDHVIPFSKGGPTTVDNLRLLCRSCNREKSNSLDRLLDA